MLLKVLLIVVFFAISITIGFIYKKSVKSTDDFSLGGRNVGPWLSAFAYGTTYFSATIFIGYSGQFGWEHGLSTIWIGLGNALIGSLFAWMVLGRRTRIMTKHLSAATMPEYFSKRYDSKPLKIISSVIIFIFLVPYTASVYKGLSKLFSLAFGIDFMWCIIGIGVLTAIFVVAGGYMGTAVNNFIQGIIMIAGILLVIYFVLDKQGGFTVAVSRLSVIPSEKAPQLNGAFVSIFGPDPLNLLSVVILTSLGTWGLPQMLHKFYAIRDEKAIKKGMFISTIFAVIIAGGSYFIGAFGKLFYSAEKIVYDEVVPDMLAKSLPDAAIGIVLIVVLSASISTLASLVISSSTTFISDFIKSFYKKIKSSAELLSIRLMCVVFIVISIIIALNPNTLITSLMGLSWGTLAGSFLGPFIYGLYWKKTTKLSVYITILAGVSINAANFFLKIQTPSIAGAFSMIISLIIIPVVSLLTPKMNKNKIDEVFECYDETVKVKLKDALDSEIVK